MKIEKELIGSMSVFGGLEDKDFELILSLADERIYSPGEVIVREGELDNLLYIIEEGEVIVEKARPGDGENQPIIKLGTKDCFGEMSLIDPQPRAATVKAVLKTRVITLSAKAINDIYRSQPKAYVIILMNLARQLSRRLRKAIEVIADLRAKANEALPHLKA